MEDIQSTREPRKPSAWLSSIPFITLIALLSCTLLIFGSDSLGGPSQIVLLTSSGVCIALGMGVYAKEILSFLDCVLHNRQEL